MLLQGNLPMEKEGLTSEFIFFKKGDLVFFLIGKFIFVFKKSKRLSFELENHIVCLKRWDKFEINF